MLKHYGAVAGIVGGVTLLQLANTLLSVVLPLTLALNGYSGTTAGLVVSGYGLGFLAGCIVTPRLIRDVGHIRAFAVLAAICSVTSMVFAASQFVALWFFLRVAMGFCQAGLFTVVEGWLSAAAPAQARGGILSFYLVATKVAIVGGQLLLGQVDTTSPIWFEVAGAVFTLSLIPVALTRTPQPPPARLEVLGPRELYRVAPAAVAGCVASGLLNSALLGLTPIYGTRVGLEPQMVVWLLTAFQLGSFVCQWPLGRLSDRLDRRLVIAGCVACRGSLVGGHGACRGRSVAPAAVLPARRRDAHLLRGRGRPRRRLRRARPDGRREQQPPARLGRRRRHRPIARGTVHRPDRARAACSSTASWSPPRFSPSCSGA